MEDKKNVLPPQRKNSGKNLKAQTQGAEAAAGNNGDSEGGEIGSTSKNRRLAGIRPRISIEELRNVFKRQASHTQEEVDPVFDPMAKAQESVKIIRGKTGVVYDERMAEHCCLWDENYPECPKRLLVTLQRCKELGFLSRCETLVSRSATEEEILEHHSRAHLGLLWSTKGETDHDKLETLASHFDTIYLHPSTYENSLLAAGSTLDLVDAVASRKLQNGFAIVRPPGHHAMESEFCGYCYINNVALAARHAIKKHGLSRILIVDWDVHHGQASQYAFYSDPRVLYFSIHRFEHGSFWPQLKESNYNYVGEGAGRGFNFNVPLNKIGMKNEDYLAIFHQVLLPVAYEFNPELIIVSAGYDAAIGCFEGEMDLSPGFYAHLTSALMTLAQGRVAVVFEGGYCLDSLAEGAAMTLSALLGDPCPRLLDPIVQPSPSLRESLLNLMYVHRPYWKCFQYQGSFSVREVLNEAAGARHIPSLTFTGPTVRPLTYPTRDIYIEQSPELLEKIRLKLNQLKQKERNESLPKNKLCLVYDEEMSRHRNLCESEHPERPERVERIWEYLKKNNIVERATVLQSRKATREEVELLHTKDHVDLMYSMEALSEEELQSLQEKYKSIYLHPKSNDAALLAVGSLLQVVDNVCNNKMSSGIGVVRPPGHHAEQDHPHGFCFYNNVAVAAKYAIRQHGYQRVLILDWDVHHGNGIQHAFESDPHVLYISIHRYDHGLFFPSSEDANYDHVGTGTGEGYNVNIPWNKSGMGDAEYISAMLQVVLPIAYQYDPQLVLVSAGFDAARGDPLGGCNVTPECYGHMTHLLSSLAGGRIVLALEGGYNLNTISFCMTMCAKALLGDPLPMLDSSLVPNKSAVQSINDVIKTHSMYWSAICFQVHLPIEDVLCQGFGGGPQAVESGMSGSEASSCASSPISTPSTISPPYISAPSSPEKLKERKLFETASITSVEYNEYKTKASTDKMEVDSSQQSSVRSQTIDKRRPSYYKRENSTQKNLKESSQHCKTAKTPPHTKESSLISKGSAGGQPRKQRRKSCRQGEGTRVNEGGSLPNTSVCHGRSSQSEGALFAAASSIDMIKVPTAIISNEDYCDACYMEYRQGCIETIIKRCEELQLLEMCTRLQPRPATKKEILSVHDEETFQCLSKGTKKCTHHPVIGDNVLTAAGSTVELVQEITSGRAQNGIAITQASDQFMSLCDTPPSAQLNNAAIGAHYAIDTLGLSRVLLIYWGGQNGINTQHIFQDDPRVLVFSIHLTKQNPQESVKDKMGDLKGLGYNFDIELNCHALHCEDYYSVFHQLLLPVAYEFSPELIIVSASCELSLHSKNIHPAIYSHLTGLLMPVAQGHIMVVLEVGEFKEAMAERVAAILRTLQDKPPEFMQVPTNNPSLEVQQAIINVISAQQANWKSLRLHAQASVISYKSKIDSASYTKPCPGKDCSCHLQRLADAIPSPKYTVCLVYDETMMEHYNYMDETHPEKPERISCIYQRLQEFGVVGRCHRIKARQASVSELESVHSPKHIKLMSSLLAKKPLELRSLQNNFDSIYLHHHTNNAALMAAGSIVAVVDSVLSGQSQRGVAVVRPPGHHAERNQPYGFCFYNNVAIAAKHSIDNHGLKRVLILDWDVHHGNGIQHMFEADPQVLYISIHRYDNGKFFPASSEGNYNRVGTKKGKGYNVNIPWNKGGMGDSDYMAAMVEVVLPIACQFNPQLVLVSAGFDAAVGDPLGGCNVTPECYGHMTKLLTSLAMGRVIVALEGGYNLNTISYCMTMCAKALLGDPLIPLAQKLIPCTSAIDTLTKVVTIHRKFWSALNFKNEAITTLAHTPASRREKEGSSPSQACSPGTPASQANYKSFEENHLGIEELTANFDRVNLDDTDICIVSSSIETPKREKLEKKKMEDDTSTMGEACGLLAESNVNTFLLSEVASAEMYAVVPVKWCPHLEQVNPVLSSGLKTASPCEECQDPSENWVCLTCYKVLCGRFVREHMLMHGLTEEHYMVLSFSDLSVWCYACDVYVHHPILFEAKRAAHLDKFGEDIPESS